MAKQNLTEKPRKGKSIQSRLILLLLFILIPVLAIQSYIYYETYQVSRAAELHANLEIAHTVAKGFDSFIKDIIHQELALGRIITSAKHMTGKDINGLLEETSQNYMTVRDFTWIDAQGIALYSSNPDLLGRHLQDRSYFRDIVNGREWIVGELVLSKSTKKPVFGVSCGIRDNKGILLGIVLGVVIPEKLGVRLAVEKSEGRTFALVDNKGALVFHHPAVNHTWKERKNFLKLLPQFKDALQGKEVTSTIL
ncbi:MAG: cache domain-containing protein, partial [Smithella sp.]